MGALGREIPPDFEHVRAMPLRAAMPDAPIIPVEKLLVLPSWHPKHDQGKEGACVGHGTSMMLSIINESRCRAKGDKTPYIRYNPFWLWKQAKTVDGFTHTDPDDGTTCRAACQILQTVGHVTWEDETNQDSIGTPELDYGIAAVRWATTVDELRTAIAQNIPSSLGINWYSTFDEPEFYNGEYWIGRAANLGIVRGGHDVCEYGASDQRQAFRIKNSWGASFPEVWVPYSTVDRLLREDGEASVVTNR